MRVIVQKYGGTSVSTVERIKSVAKKVVEACKDDQRVVVVVSAMADTTDDLINLARQITENPREREMDMLLTAGERISMALMSMAIWSLGCPAISFTGSQSGIITDSAHTRARITEVRASRIIEELNNGKVVIVAGFQGVSPTREITTLGRGGSDTTAVALACALGADVCEIYSDVDGVYSGDPNKISDARHIQMIDYETLLDAAFYGAQVIHFRAVELARRFQIPLKLLKSWGEGGFTMVEPKTMESARIVMVSGKNKVLWINAFPESLDELNELLHMLDIYRVTIGNPTVLARDNGFDVNFWLIEEERSNIPEILGGTRYSMRDDVGVVAIVGCGIVGSATAISDMTKILSESEIPVFWAGAASNSVFAVVPSDIVNKAMETLHKKMVKK